MLSSFLDVWQVWLFFFMLFGLSAGLTCAALFSPETIYQALLGVSRIAEQASVGASAAQGFIEQLFYELRSL